MYTETRRLCARMPAGFGRVSVCVNEWVSECMRCDMHIQRFRRLLYARSTGFSFSFSAIALSSFLYDIHLHLKCGNVCVCVCLTVLLLYHGILLAHFHQCCSWCVCVFSYVELRTYECVVIWIIISLFIPLMFKFQKWIAMRVCLCACKIRRAKLILPVHCICIAFCILTAFGLGYNISVSYERIESDAVREYIFFAAGHIHFKNPKCNASHSTGWLLCCLAIGIAFDSLALSLCLYLCRSPLHP